MSIKRIKKHNIKQNNEKKDDDLIIFNMAEVTTNESYGEYTKVNLTQINNFLNHVKDKKNSDILYKLSKTFYENVVPIDYEEMLIGKLDLQTNINLALDFFKSVDNKYYNKAKNILSNNSDIKINFSDFEDLEQLNYKKSNLFDDPTIGSVIIVEDGKCEINISLYGDITDSFSIVHEIAHTFDSSKNFISSSKDYLCEITSITMEKLFSDYLYQKNIIDKKVLRQLNKERTVIVKQKSLQNLIQFDLLEQKEKYGRISDLELEDIRNKYGLSPNLFNLLLFDTVTSYEDYIFNSRYIIAELATTKMFSNLEKNKIIDNYDKYTYRVERKEKERALYQLGLDMKNDNIEDLIDDYNLYLKNMILEDKIDEEYGEKLQDTYDEIDF